MLSLYLSLLRNNSITRGVKTQEIALAPKPVAKAAVVLSTAPGQTVKNNNTLPAFVPDLVNLVTDPSLAPATDKNIVLPPASLVQPPFNETPISKLPTPIVVVPNEEPAAKIPPTPLVQAVQSPVVLPAALNSDAEPKTTEKPNPQALLSLIAAIPSSDNVSDKIPQLFKDLGIDEKQLLTDGMTYEARKEGDHLIVKVGNLGLMSLYERKISIDSKTGDVKVYEPTFPFFINREITPKLNKNAPARVENLGDIFKSAVGDLRAEKDQDKKEREESQREKAKSAIRAWRAG